MDMCIIDNLNKELKERDLIRILSKGIVGGILIGICCMMSIKILSLDLPYGFLINAIFFPFGIIMCNLCGATLFTGNCIYFITDEDILTFEKVAVTMAGNYVGMIGIGLSSIILLKNSVVPVVNLSYHYLFISGIFCNILITLSTYFAKISKNIIELIISMWAPVAIFIICGFHHGVVMMYYNMFLAIDIYSLIIVIVGNIVGGYIISKLIKTCKY